MFARILNSSILEQRILLERGIAVGYGTVTFSSSVWLTDFMSYLEGYLIDV